MNIIYYIIFFLLVIIVVFYKNTNTNKEELKNPVITIYIIGQKKEYRYFEDYVDGIINKLKKLKIPTVLYKDSKISDDYFEDKKDSIFIFLHNIDYVDMTAETKKKIIKKSYIINTEQLTRRSELKKMADYVDEGFKIIDYSLGNIEILDELNISKDMYFYIPYQVNYDEINPKIKKTEDICTIQPIGYSRHRKYMYYSIQSFNIFDVKPIVGFGKHRDEQLLQFKYLINIHFDKSYSTYESIRCDRLIMNKIVILSEKSIESSIPEDIKRFIVEFSSLSELYVYMSSLREETYDLMWKDFNLKEIDKGRERELKVWLDDALKSEDLFDISLSGVV